MVNMLKDSQWSNILMSHPEMEEEAGAAAALTEEEIEQEIDPKEVT